MQNLSNEKSPSRRRPLLPLQREDVPGCKQVPLEYTKNIVRWAHPDGYFLNAQGQKVAHCFSPAHLKIPNDPTRKTGKLYPYLRETAGSKACHILMALAFYGPRPTFENTSLPLQGKGLGRGSYVGICHHLIPDALDYRPANLLCWLTRAEHTEADRRQRALKKVVPDGNLRLFTYERLRELQDPRTMSREQFETELAALADQHFTRDTFATNPPPGLTPFDARMEYDMTHHMEI